MKVVNDINNWIQIELDLNSNGKLYLKRHFHASYNHLTSKKQLWWIIVIGIIRQILMKFDLMYPRVQWMNHLIYYHNFWICDQCKGLQKWRPRGKLRSHISCSQECKKMWGNESSHSQVSSHFENCVQIRDVKFRV